MPGECVRPYIAKSGISLQGRVMPEHGWKYTMLVSLDHKLARLLQREFATRRCGPRPQRIGAVDEPIGDSAAALPLAPLGQRCCLPGDAGHFRTQFPAGGRYAAPMLPGLPKTPHEPCSDSAGARATGVTLRKQALLHIGKTAHLST